MAAGGWRSARFIFSDRSSAHAPRLPRFARCIFTGDRCEGRAFARLLPLGDVDETELDFADPLALEGVPPAIEPLRRQMLLTRLVLKKDKNLPLDQAASMAEALGRFLDQMQIEERDFAALKDLVPSDFAEHWQETLLFLEIVTHEWPRILAERGLTDPALRRRAALEAQAKVWRDKPTEQSVIAAGSTGSFLSWPFDGRDRDLRRAR